MVYGLTPLGIFHTAISLVAVFSGAVSLVRYRRISSGNRVGNTYIVTTIVTCVTGFGIFQHGGFGKPHVLGILTLLVLAVALIASRNKGKMAPFVADVAYSMTFLFHLIPGITETFTRLPADHPWASGPDDPNLQPIIGGVALLFVIGALLQVNTIRKQRSGKG